MTNEYLARNATDNSDAVRQLWDNLFPFYCKASWQFYQAHKEQCIRRGVTLDDIRQECYFAMLDSIKAFNHRSPEQENLHFISFCGFPFKNHAAALAGIRTRRKDPLDIAVSLDEPYNGDTVERLQLIPDESAQVPLDRIDSDDYNRAVRETVREELCAYPRELEAIEHSFYEGQTNEAAGACMGVSHQYVRSLKRSALTRLKQSGKLRTLFYGNPYRTVGAAECLRSGSIVEQLVEKAEKRRF